MAKVAPLKGYLGLSNQDVPRVNQSLRMRLNIYPQTTESPAEGSLFVKRKNSRKITLDWTGDSQMGLQMFDWNKQMGQPSGAWMAMAKEKPGKDLGIEDGQIMDGDWCDVSILRNGVEIPLCRGVVDTVREQTQSAGGATVRTWMLAGRDHGFAFEYPITYQNLWAQTLGEIFAGMVGARVKGKVGGRPDEMFRVLIKAAFIEGRQTGQWELPTSLADTVGGKKRLRDLLSVIAFAATKASTQTGLRGAYYNEPQLWTAGGQTLHQTLQQWVNPLLNEIYYDLLPPIGFTPANGLGGWFLADPDDVDVDVEERVNQLGGALSAVEVEPDGEFGTVAAYIRERPFPNTIEGDSSLWFDLPEWRIPRWCLQAVDLGRGGHERYNLFELMADLGSMGPSTEQAAICPPTWNKLDIRQRGLRIFSQTTRYLAQFKTGMGDWHRERVTWQDLLRDWHAPLPYLRQGTVTAKVMLPEVRIGQKLVIDEGGAEEDNERLYVEGVRLRWEGPQGPTKPPTGSTTWTLTHGFRGTDKQYLDAVKGTVSLFTGAF
jgi:hypothetical protein